MHGNAGEWVWDVYAPYPAEPVRDPVGPTGGTKRVVRDVGSSVRRMRSAARLGTLPAARFGFRVARGAADGH